MAIGDVNKVRIQNIMGSLGYDPFQGYNFAADPQGLGGDIQEPYQPMGTGIQPPYQQPDVVNSGLDNSAPSTPYDGSVDLTNQFPTNTNIFDVIGNRSKLAQIGKPPEPIDPYDPTKAWERMQQFLDKNYTPETAAEQRFNALLDKFPNRSDYEPSFARKLVASMAGFKGGVDAADKIVSAPYGKALSDWTAQVAPDQQAATLENQRNVNERQLAVGTAQQIETSLRNADNARIADNKNAIQAAKNDATAQNQAMRNLINLYIGQGKNVEWNTKGPTVLVKHADGSIEDTGMPTGNMDQMTAALMKAASAREVQGMRNAGAANVATINEGGTYIDGSGTMFRAQGGRITDFNGNPYTPTGDVRALDVGNRGNNTAVTPTGQKTEIGLNMQRAYAQSFDTHPEWQQFLKMNSDGSGSVSYRTENIPSKPKSIMGYQTESDADFQKRQAAWNSLNAFIQGNAGAGGSPNRGQGTNQGGEVNYGYYPPSNGRTGGGTGVVIPGSPGTNKGLAPTAGGLFGKPASSGANQTQVIDPGPPPASIPRDAVRKQYQVVNGVVQWRYQDKAGNWHNVGAQ